jgi:hypothetical protein
VHHLFFCVSILHHLFSLCLLHPLNGGNRFLFYFFSLVNIYIYKNLVSSVIGRKKKTKTKICWFSFFLKNRLFSLVKNGHPRTIGSIPSDGARPSPTDPPLPLRPTPRVRKLLRPILPRAHHISPISPPPPTSPLSSRSGESRSVSSFRDSWKASVFPFLRVDPCCSLQLD